MRKFASGLLPVLLPIGLVAAIGCGGGSGKPNIDTTGPYLPLKVGNEWQYKVTETDGTISGYWSFAITEGRSRFQSDLTLTIYDQGRSQIHITKADDFSST